ncbi:heme ABC exporter ATP-binding protein CcmA [Rhodobacterales bacterium HKCCE2091]|nr:heme ABC exporter ATP-binding protein CcmA [Rhodobacterales bacterium HKCCE2091]
MVLAVMDLSVGRGLVEVLRGVSFRLAPGAALVLRGPNGAGKTTLLRTLAGLTPPFAGRVEAEPDSVAYAGHADGIKAQLTVAENLDFWAAVFGRDEVGAAMDAFDLRGLADRRAGELSAGQKRRLSLARLLVAGRPVWCLDEPTVSLDAENVARFAAAVTAHLAAGGAAVMATHIELGIGSAETLDVARFAAPPPSAGDPGADPFGGDAPL